MLVIKRDGSEATFDRNKIINAIVKAYDDAIASSAIREIDITKVAQSIAQRLYSRYHYRNRAVSVENIQDDVETELMLAGATQKELYEVAKAYIRYRYEHERLRKGNSTDSKIITLVDGVNEVVKQENSNKNPAILSTQRDYIAGEISRDITERMLLPKDIATAHQEGIIHFHDTDYYVQRMFNCCLVNLEDMLQNGTVISGTMIEKPHSFSTACNIATQIIAQVASCQYGGQSISLAHLAPFVDVSRKKIRRNVEAEIAAVGGDMRKVDEITEKRVREEVKKGIQTIQYQVTTLMTTNGQAPFITVFMWLGEVEEGRTKDDLAMMIEEVVKQRYQGTKNEKGVWVTPAFPKLIYVLEEDNIHEDSKYWYLTELCAKCSAKRLVPDYISAKKMLEYKGDIYTCMGCRSFLTPDRFTAAGVGNIANAGNYVPGKHKYYGRLTIS